jgi:FkbM family methyltransferase
LYGRTLDGLKLIDKDTVSYNYKGRDIVAPRNSTKVFMEIFFEEIYEKMFKPSGTVIDIGAYVGMFTVKASFSARKVIAVEPCLETFEMLRNNCKGIPNVELVQKALWSESGTTKLYLQDSTICNSLVCRRNRYVDVETITLDSLVSEPVDFIKMDAEGAELEILKGAERTLSYPGTKLAIAAYHDLPNGEPELPQLVAHLDRRGYKVYTSESYVYAEKLGAR